jgi:filamentous hemagglutinin
MSREGAEAEFRKLLSRTLPDPSGADRLLRGRDLVSIQVTVEPVLDLTSTRVLASNGINSATLIGDDDTSLEACRSIADWARDQGFRAILAPSAATTGADNLMIYIEGPAASLLLEAGPDRIPLGKA